MELTEVLARAWIDCDPNRMGAERFSGFHPDDMNKPRGPSEAMKMGLSKEAVASIIVKQAKCTGDPYWMRFIHRAEALTAYLEKHGYKIVPI